MDDDLDLIDDMAATWPWFAVVLAVFVIAAVAFVG
jgi:F0F1-type ATP synthase assembly protein I